MKTRVVFSEHAEDEIWRLLKTYTYSNNIKKYFENGGAESPDNDLIEGISGSIIQAKEYFDASKNVSLQISPLLLYYGATNLFYGGACLRKGKLLSVKNHGMNIKFDNYTKSLSEIRIFPCNPENGALSIFTQIYSGKCNINNSSFWDLHEIFGSIPDLLDEYLYCYNNKKPFVIPIEITKMKDQTIERIDPVYLNRFKEIDKVFQSIIGFKENYLRPQSSDKYIILRHKIKYKNIACTSISGQNFLQIGHAKQGQLFSPNVEIYIFMGLFLLGYLSRYRPDIWNPFVKTDKTGERLIVEKFLYIAQRIIPNIVLNFINDEYVSFTNESLGFTDYSNNINEKEIENIVKKEILRNKDQENMRFK